MTSKFLSPLFAALILGTATISCGKDKPVTSETLEVTATREGQVYVIDTMNSRIEWKGFKVFKSENTSHFGTIKFETGDVTVKDGQLESGKFVADMATHLKSGDFFEVEKFPTASYEITNVTPLSEGDYNTLLDGNLTIKGITKPVKFNANVAVSQGEVSIATEPTDIMREDFGVKFQVPVQNGLIKNEVNVQIRIKAMQQK